MPDRKLSGAATAAASNKRLSVMPPDVTATAFAGLAEKFNEVGESSAAMLGTPRGLVSSSRTLTQTSVFLERNIALRLRALHAAIDRSASRPACPCTPHDAAL